MPGPPRQFDEDEVVRIASDVFRERGYAKTSLSEVQRRAGLSRQSLYNAFANKETLFEAVLTLYEREQLGALAEVLRGPGSGRTRLLRVLETVARSAKDADCPGCLFANAVGELGGDHGDIRARLRQGFDGLEAAACGAAKDAIDAGELAPGLKARDVARLVLALVEGVSVFNRLHTGPAFSQSVVRALRILLEAS